MIALIVSTWFFEEVVSQEPAASSYRQVEVDVKETRTSAWITVLNDAHERIIPELLTERGAERGSGDTTNPGPDPEPTSSTRS